MTAPPPRSGRRRLRLLAFAPVLLGAAYALGHATFAPTPTWGNLAPADTVWFERHRNLSVFGVYGALRERPSPDGDATDPRRWVEGLGERINVPDLVGVDPDRPVARWRQESVDATPRDAIALSLRDADRFTRRFRAHGIDLTTPRHALWLSTKGGIAVLASHPDILDRVGDGGLPLASEGEDLAVAADVPRLVRLALQQGFDGPFAPFLEGLGVKRVEVREALARGLPFPYDGTERVATIADAWRDARAWIWLGDATSLPRARVEIGLAEGAAAATWRRLLAHVGEPLQVEMPVDGELHVVAGLSGGTAPALLRFAATLLGANLTAFSGEEVDRLVGGASIVPPSAWAWSRAPNAATTALAVASRDRDPPSPDLFGLSEHGAERVARTVGAWRIVAVGGEAQRAADRWGAHRTTDAGLGRVPEVDVRSGRRLVRAILRRQATYDLLGPTLLTGGALFTPFDGRPLIVDVRATADGLVVYVDVHDW